MSMAKLPTNEIVISKEDGDDGKQTNVCGYGLIEE